MKTPIRIFTVVALGLCSVQAATIIDAGNFVSNGSGPQTINGTTTGITVNLPGGNWVWGGGWNWGAPNVPATWGTPLNGVALGEENTVLSLALGSTGGYTKPTSFTVSARIGVFQNITAGVNGDRNDVNLGFWSTQPIQANGGSSLTNFSGFRVDVENSNIRLYSGGVLQGSAVSLGTLAFSTLYDLSYNVDTGTGAISGVKFNGSSVSGFSSTAFTNFATSFVGVASGTQSRAGFDDLIVAAVPEPSTWALLLSGGLVVAYLRRTRWC